MDKQIMLADSGVEWFVMGGRDKIPSILGADMLNETTAVLAVALPCFSLGREVACCGGSSRL